MRKLALNIGINDYPGTDSDLTGCVNDAAAWRDALEARGFQSRTIFDREATGDHIRRSIGEFVDACNWGDICVITYSGHGTWTPDLSGDEVDRRDEALVPADVMTNGVITDDELHELFGSRNHGARIIMVSDSCHSGTVTRLAGPVMGDRPRVRFLPPQVWLPAGDLPAARAVAAVRPGGRPRPTALLMSGCADAEYSYDGYAGKQMGAFSYVALEALGRLPKDATYRDWHAAIRAQLPTVDIPQTPQLSATRTQRAWPVLEPLPRRAAL